MNRALRTTIAVVPLLWCGCAEELYAEVTVDRVCITRLQESIPGAPAAAVEVSWGGTFDLGSTLSDDAISGTMQLLDFTVDAGGTDLSGITAIDVSVVDEHGVAIPVAAYAAPQPAHVPTTSFSATVTSDLDLYRYLQAETLRYAVVFRGTPPASDWTADIEMCMSAKVRIDPL